MSIDPLVQSALISGGLTIIGLIVGWFITWRLNRSQASSFDASAAQTIVNSARDLLPMLEVRINDLEKIVVRLRLELGQAEQGLKLANERIQRMTEAVAERDTFIEGMRSGLAVLSNQLREAKLEPRYTPPAAPGYRVVDL